MTGLARWITGLSLTARVVAMLAIALLPLGLIAVHQTNQTVEETRALERSAFLGAAERAAREERNLLTKTYGQASALGHVIVNYRDNPARCGEILASFVEGSAEHIFAGFIPLDGMMTCSSNGVTQDFSASPNFAAVMEEADVRAVVRAAGSQTGRPVTIISAPVRENGVFLGYLSISVPTILFDEMSERSEMVTIALLDREDRLFASPRGAGGEPFPLPVDLSVLDRNRTGSSTFIARDEGGERRLYAIIPIFGDQISGLASMPIAGDARILATRFAPVLFPLIMWIVSLVVAFLAVDRLVIRHVKRLEAYVIAYSNGDREPPANQMDDAPGELRNLGESLRTLIAQVAQDEADRERALDEKSVLLKEVHHRVKNNLQLISSITNMQIRLAHTADARAALSRVQERVLSLAAVHRMLYTAASLTQVRADHLIDVIVNQVSMLGDEKRQQIHVETRLEPVALYPDQAMPLALLVSEATTNAIKHMTSIDAPSRLSISLTLDAEDQITLVIVNTLHNLPVATGTDDAEDVTSDGLGSQLIEAFAQQLDAEMNVEKTGGLYRVALTFARAEFSEEDAPQGN
ncbi:two-component sensor histidine kinase [Rubricella aquisinus]|uniref:histidine kinase n=1 Tax=Rubricella aquisinus TaxID=2028108 RepID=A0A840X282_9RHOB|nr:sensor histidine kinase [Rubricella aquisinus]MBB5515966.1 two-component sensor histidine kinase [Rubricella aquisinus]